MTVKELKRKLDEYPDDMPVAHENYDYSDFGEDYTYSTPDFKFEKMATDGERFDHWLTHDKKKVLIIQAS